MKFKLPDLGENVEDATVVTVSVSTGDTVEEEQTILELETDKATFDVPSPVAGSIESIEVSEGDTVKPGDLVAVIKESDGSDDEEDSEEDKEGSAKKKSAEEDEASSESEKEGSDDRSSDGEPEPSSDRKPKDAEDEAPRKEDAEESDPEEKGSDRGSDREESEDESKKEEEAKGEKEDEGEDEPERTRSDRRRARLPVFAAPSARIFAREIGVDLSSVSGTGPGGRISVEDIKRYARHNRPEAKDAPVSSGPVRAPLPDLSQWGKVEEESLSRVRKATAKAMQLSWSRIPHVTLTAKADSTRLEASIRSASDELRKRDEPKVTLTAVMVKIAAVALDAYPNFAASFDADAQTMIRRNYRHLGVAVDTPRGLVVPVLREADRKPISVLAAELQSLASKAREGKLPPDALSGSVFTVTNLGGLGTEFFTPIVNFPEVGILGIGRSTTEAVYSKDSDRFEPRQQLPLSLSFDHRAVDGADGARFLQWIVKAIEEPLRLAL